MHAKLIEIAFGLVTTVIVPLVTALLVQWLRKLNLDISGQQQAKIQYHVQQAVLEAEEWAARRLQANIATTPGDKLDRATTTITAKLPGVDLTEAADLVHAELPKAGLGAAAPVPTSTVAVVKS
jgi:hypothetical protein